MYYSRDEYRHVDLPAWLADTDLPGDYLALCIGSKEARRDDLRTLLNLSPIIE